MEKIKKGAGITNTPLTTTTKVLNIHDTRKDMQVVLEFFRYVETTRLDCSLCTGILLGSVCRYVDYLLKIGALEITKIAPDKRTKHNAQYLSANADLWKKTKCVQLFLFREV